MKILDQDNNPNLNQIKTQPFNLTKVSIYFKTVNIAVIVQMKIKKQ